MKNIIYCFTGTGNSLYAAQKIAESIGNCDILPVTGGHTNPPQCDCIGFVYPVYFQGLPLILHDFVEKLNLSHNKDTYFFAVATYGGAHGNGLPQLDRLLQKMDISLSFGIYLRMFSNYVVMYNMSKDIVGAAQKSDQDLADIIPRITAREEQKVGRSKALLDWYYHKRAKAVWQMDQHYQCDSNECISCGICEQICPVKNINLTNGTPEFLHHCEQCMACIQFCPKRAINYKDKTTKRRRYTNPAVDHKQLQSLYR